MYSPIPSAPRLWPSEFLDFGPQYGSDGYSGQFSRPSTVSSNTAYNVAGFLLGARSPYSLANWVVVDYRQRMNFFYFQDNWKVSKKLTINVGVRYEYATPQWEAQNRLANFDSVALKLVQAPGGGSMHGPWCVRIATTGRRGWVSLTTSRRRRSSAADTESATFTSTAWAGKTPSPTTATL